LGQGGAPPPIRNRIGNVSVLIQSEGMVWPAFVARRKSVTRRTWSGKTAAQYYKGLTFQAFDTAPFRGGRKIGEARVTADPFRQRLSLAPDEDYEAEGFAYFHEHPNLIPARAAKEVWAQEGCSFAAFDRWRQTDAEVWVCPFEITKIEDYGIEALEDLLAKEFEAPPGKLF